MTEQEKNDLILMLLVENLAIHDSSFSSYVSSLNTEAFNKDYYILLDKFLNKYALNKTEKSE